MTQQHPITPPQELRDKWLDEAPNTSVYDYLIDSAAQWGADQELDACCMEIIDGAGLFYIDETGDRVRLTEDIRATRRPKPLSLKEQAKFAAAVLRSPDETCSIAELQQHWHTICNALEQLND